MLFCRVALKVPVFWSDSGIHCLKWACISSLGDTLFSLNCRSLLGGRKYSGRKRVGINVLCMVLFECYPEGEFSKVVCELCSVVLPWDEI